MKGQIILGTYKLKPGIVENLNKNFSNDEIKILDLETIEEVEINTDKTLDLLIVDTTTASENEINRISYLTNDSEMFVIAVDDFGVYNESVYRLPKCEDNELDISNNIIKVMVESIRKTKDKHHSKSEEHKTVDEEFINFLEKIMGFIEEKDSGTKNHCRRVAYYGYIIGESLNLDEDTKKRIYKAGLIHDIGKIGIPDNILTKKGKLTNEEYTLMKEHSKIAYDLLPDYFCSDLKEIIVSHHERFDGKGYPDGKKMNDIPLESRILTIADAFDAMTTDRTYNKKRTTKEALEELKDNSGTQFDPEIVNAFYNMLLLNQMDHVFETLKLNPNVGKIM